jgi:hypothetical protein
MKDGSGRTLRSDAGIARVTGSVGVIARVSPGAVSRSITISPARRIGCDVVGDTRLVAVIDMVKRARVSNQDEGGPSSTYVARAVPLLSTVVSACAGLAQTCEIATISPLFKKLD